MLNKQFNIKAKFTSAQFTNRASIDLKIYLLFNFRSKEKQKQRQEKEESKSEKKDDKHSKSINTADEVSNFLIDRARFFNLFKVAKSMKHYLAFGGA